MKQKLVIVALGYSNSGKSTTWYTLLERVIKIGWKKFRIKEDELIDVFVVNGSMEERGTDIEYVIDGLPELVFCSVQYSEGGIDTLEYFRARGYYLYIQWLNPGYHGTEYEDYLNFEERFTSAGEFHRRTGKEFEVRTNEIRRFLIKWLA